jgi:hypothetical protein
MHIRKLIKLFFESALLIRKFSVSFLCFHSKKFSMISFSNFVVEQDIGKKPIRNR